MTISEAEAQEAVPDTEVLDRPEVVLTPHQQAAYDLLQAFALGQGERRGMATLVGYAGTGKTTLVGKLVRYLQTALDDDGEPVFAGRLAIAAPTNKAVAVLAAKIGAGGDVHAASIHSLLGLKLVEQENGDAKCLPDGEPSLHEFNLVIVDECSMVGDDLFQHAVQHRDACRILWVGDSAQLPPVGDDELSPTFSIVDYKVMLSEVVRQAAGNPIIALSMRIREWIERNHRPEISDIRDALQGTNRREASVTVGRPGDIHAFAKWSIEQDKDSCRIVAFTNAQVIAHNAAMHRILHGVTEFPYCPGETVIAQEAFTGKRLDADGAEVETYKAVNSAEFEIVSIGADETQWRMGIDSLRLVLQDDRKVQFSCHIARNQQEFGNFMADRWRQWRAAKLRAEEARKARDPDAYKLTETAKDLSASNWDLSKAFAPLRHAYAVTAHKSQGSTYDTVIVDWQDLAKMRSAFDFNRALYVACTRAAKNLAIVV